MLGFTMGKTFLLIQFIVASLLKQPCSISNAHHTSLNSLKFQSIISLGFTMGKISPAFLIFIMFLVSELWFRCSGQVAGGAMGCTLRERNALLRFKASLSDPSDRLSSWNTATDCCEWQGVKCDQTSGHVIGLDLKNKRYGDLDSPSTYMLHSEALNSSILELKHLSFLDLSGNDFHLASIPSFLGSMSQMQHLYLSTANFSGVVPHHIGRLSLLNVLDLSSNGFNGQLIVDDFTWVSHLSMLRHLNMSGVDLSRTNDLLKVLNMLPSAVDLRFSSSNLENKNLEHACVNSALGHIELLDLSDNMFHGELPCFLENMSSLTYLLLDHNNYNSCNKLHLTKLTNLVALSLGYNSLPCNVDSVSEFMIRDKLHLEYLFLFNNSCHGDVSKIFLNLSRHPGNELKILQLGRNNFSGQLPEDIGELRKLELLSLDSNPISGPIPTSIGNLSALEYLNLWNNSFNGKIPASLGQLPNLEFLDLSDNKLDGPIPTSIGNLSALNSLYITGNQLNGKIPASLGQLSNLEELGLFNNNFDGPIPTSIRNLSALQYLLLGDNQLNGEIPTFLGQLSNLERLDLSNNELSGTIVESHFSRHSKLRRLMIGYNSLKVGMRSNWVPPFQLEEIDISSCDVGGEFPEWLQTQTELQTLHMSNCSISKPLPNWIWFKNLIYLVLSHNSIHGVIPDSLCQLEYFRELDLSRNRVSGNLPECLGNITTLRYLILSSNHLSGVIPDSIGGAYSLRWLQLSGNRFTGKLPPTMKNCSRLEVLDIGENSISGEVPEWIGINLWNMQRLRLSNNEFYGAISSHLCKLSRLHILDLANNELNGSIPTCLDNITSMVSYNSDHGIPAWYPLELMTKGVQQEYYSTLKYVVYMDLSDNSLVGEIPVEITKLVAMRFLNLSHNYLRGAIPQRIGDMNMLESLDLSNNNLSGNIPPSLSNLNFLNDLNLSHNNLTGEIPTGNQLQTLEATSYEDNPGLCGAPLRSCHGDGASKVPAEETPDVEDEEDKIDRIWLYGIVTTGFATGLWSTIGVLVFKRSWNNVFFKFTDGMIARMMRV